MEEHIIGIEAATIANQREEEYDDLEGDKPSCRNGVHRRLFHSVLGHSLFQRLTKEGFEEELRAYVRNFYSKFFNALPQEEFTKLYNYLKADNPEGYFITFDTSYLVSIPNMKEFDELRFRVCLTEKYNCQIEEQSIKNLITEAWKLEDCDNSHFIKFYTRFYLKDMLEDIYTKRSQALQRINFFSQTSSANEAEPELERLSQNRNS